MLNTIKLVSNWLGTDPVEQLAERVACRSRMAVWQRVNRRLPLLGPTEGRGYLRARAAGVIHEETLRLIEQEGTRIARLQAIIEQAALSRLVSLVTMQLSQRQPAVAVRAAA
jgi:hypothetical protein